VLIALRIVTVYPLDSYHISSIAKSASRPVRSKPKKCSAASTCLVASALVTPQPRFASCRPLLHSALSKQRFQIFPPHSAFQTAPRSPWWRPRPLRSTACYRCQCWPISRCCRHCHRRRVREVPIHSFQTLTHFSDTPGVAVLPVSWLQVAGTMQFGHRWSKRACTAARCIRYGSIKLRAAAHTPS
jgi:hypothetical protein